VEGRGEGGAANETGGRETAEDAGEEGEGEREEDGCGVERYFGLAGEASLWEGAEQER